MSYIITPSEKARSTTNPQPISSFGNGDISPLRLFLKNLFGLPIPWLQFIYVAFFLCSTLLLEISSWLILGLTIFYILIDLAGKQRELRWFITGFEIPVLLLIVCGTITYSMTASSFVDFFIYFRWTLWLLIFPLLFHLFPGINKFFYVLFYGGLIFVLYGFVQHFTGFYIPGTQEVVLFKAFDNFTTYVATGFFANPIVYGFFFSFISGFIWTAYFLHLEEKGKTNWFYLLMGLLFLFAAVFTYDLRVWLTAILSVWLPVFFISKKHFFITVILTLVVGYSLFILFDFFRESVLFLEANFSVLREKMNLQNQFLFENISNNVWFGSGNFNTPTVDILLQKPETKAIMDNTFLKILADMGALGLVAYLIFILQGFMLNLRLIKEVPATHKWHKVIVLGAFVMQINFHWVGLFYPSLFHPHLLQLYIFLLAILAYFSDAYGRGIVPDDYSL